MTEAPKPWRLTWGDHSFTFEDMTGAHLTLIGAALGEDTWDINPAAGPRRLQAVLGACVAFATGRRLDDVCAELAAAPASALSDALSTDDN